MGQRSHTTLLLLLAVAAANLQQANTNQSSTSQAVSSFSCVEKVIGGYYADISLGCTMFHVCTLGEKGEIRDIIFKCVPGTLFSQEKRVCEREDEVNCPMSKQFYHLNNDLYGPGIIPETATVVETGSEHLPTNGDKNTAPIVSRKQSSIQFAPTSFTCADKIHGGLYADVEAGCSVFHICSVEPDGSYRSSRFVCGSGTLFDQTSRTCQAEGAVNCARSQSLYYLNEPFQTPDGEADLCHTRPVGTPLADITTSCKEYTVCEVSNGQIVEQRYPCKTGQAFSQLHRKCLSATKVKCAKETLSEILGLGAMRDTAGRVLNRRKRGPKSLLHSYRFRRAALPPLSNLVLTPGVQDARVRRALYNLAALQQWAQDNSHHTAFVEVYTLHSRGKKNYYPKKINLERSYVPQSLNNNYNTYSYVRRSKRQTREDAHLIGKSNIGSQSVTSTGISSSKVEVSKVASKLQLQTITVPATTTTTKSTVPITTSAKLEEPTPPSIVDPATKQSSSTLSSTKVSSHKITEPLLTITVTTAQPSTLYLNNDNSSNIAPDPVTPTPSITSTTNNASSVTPSLETSSPNSELTATTPSTTTMTTTPLVPELLKTPVKNESQSLNQASSELINEDLSVVTNETIVKDLVISTDNITAVGINSTNITNTETSTPTTPTVTSTEAEVTSSTTPKSPLTDSTVAVTNASSVTTSTTTTTETPTTVSQSPTVATVSAPPGSTIISSPETTSSTTTVTAVTQPPPIITPQTTKPLSRDDLPETSFTCKDKTLEKFYPDTEVNCQVFHYCSPGFTQEQVLDIKFLCTNNTVFDSETQKCENSDLVECNTTTNHTVTPTKGSEYTNETKVIPNTAPTTAPITNPNTPPTPPTSPITATTPNTAIPTTITTLKPTTPKPTTPKPTTPKSTTPKPTTPKPTTPSIQSTQPSSTTKNLTITTPPTTATPTTTNTTTSTTTTTTTTIAPVPITQAPSTIINTNSTPTHTNYTFTTPPTNISSTTTITVPSTAKTAPVSEEPTTISGDSTTTETPMPQQTPQVQNSTTTPEKKIISLTSSVDEAIDQTTKHQTTEVATDKDTESGTEASTVSSSDIKTFRSDSLSITVEPPEEEEDVTELGPLNNGLSVQLTTVSSTERITTSSSPSASHSPTQSTQLAR